MEDPQPTASAASRLGPDSEVGSRTLIKGLSVAPTQPALS